MARYAINGHKVREVRLSKGVGSKDLAKKADISERTLLELEEGKRKVNEETLFSICKALEIEASTVLAPAE